MRVCMSQVHVCVHHPVWDVCIFLYMCVCLTDMYTCILSIGTFNCTFACVSMRAFVCMHEHVCVLDL